MLQALKLQVPKNILPWANGLLISWCYASDRLKKFVKISETKAFKNPKNQSQDWTEVLEKKKKQFRIGTEGSLRDQEPARGFEIAGSEKNLSRANEIFLDAMCMVNVLACRYSIVMTRKTHSFRQAAATKLRVDPGKRVENTTHDIKSRFKARFHVLVLS
jgi:hypothetical protein